MPVKFPGLLDSSIFGGISSYLQVCVSLPALTVLPREDARKRSLHKGCGIKLLQCWRRQFQGHSFRIPRAHFHPLMELFHFNTEGETLS